MNSKKIVLISNISLLTFVFLVGSMAYASEVIGTLSSAGVSNVSLGTTGILSGTVGSASGGSSTVSGTFGGGGNSTVSGTVVSGSVTGGSGGGGSSGGGGGGSSIVGSVTNGAPSSSLASNVQSSPNSSISGNESFATVPASTQNTDGTNLLADTASPVVADVQGQNPGNPNINQTASAVGSGIFGSWIWWILFIIVCVGFGYYLYDRRKRKM